jgi:hypothetical protein
VRGSLRFRVSYWVTWFFVMVLAPIVAAALGVLLATALIRANDGAWPWDDGSAFVTPVVPHGGDL